MNSQSEYTDSVVFDVREIPCRIKHGQIFQRWLDLPVGQFFVLLNDHDPVPLRYQFEAQFPGAVGWEYLEMGPEEFRVKITKLVETKSPNITAAAPRFLRREDSACNTTKTLVVDARGLEPPEPLMRILNELENLPDGVRLRAITDRKPCHLFGEAEQRGFRHDSTEQPDGSWITNLSRA